MINIIFVDAFYYLMTNLMVMQFLIEISTNYMYMSMHVHVPIMDSNTSLYTCTSWHTCNFKKFFLIHKNQI